MLKITRFRHVLPFLHFPLCSDRFLLAKIARQEGKVIQ